MNRVGTTVFLDVDPKVLFSRLRVAKQQRPILQGKKDDELLDFIVQALENVRLFIVRLIISIVQTNWKTVVRLKHPCNNCVNF